MDFFSVQKFILPGQPEDMPEEEKAAIYFKKANALEVALWDLELAQLETHTTPDAIVPSPDYVRFLVRAILPHVTGLKKITIGGQKVTWDSLPEGDLDDNEPSKVSLLLNLGSGINAIATLTGLFNCIRYGLSPDQKKALDAYLRLRLDQKSEDAPATSVQESPTLTPSDNNEPS